MPERNVLSDEFVEANDEFKIKVSEFETVGGASYRC